MISAQPLLDALAQTVGHPLSFDETGQCGLVFAGNRLLVVAALDENNVSLRVELLDLDLCGSPDEQRHLLRRCMELNYSSAQPGMWLALCSESNDLVLMGLFNREGDPQDFVDSVEIMLSQAAAARDALLSQVDAGRPHADEAAMLHLRG